MDLGFTTTEHGRWVVLSVSGEVDVATAPQLRERLVDLVGEGHAHLILDLNEVGFLDSTGLGVIVGCLKRARGNDGDLVIVCDQRSILKVLEITGLTAVFQLHPTVEGALADLA
jgi:anti-sigma B factor antagonist